MYSGGGGGNGRGDLASKTDDVANIRHSRRAAKEARLEPPAVEEAMEEEVTASTAIDKAEEEVVANVARFTAQLVICTLSVRTGRVERGEMS